MNQRLRVLRDLGVQIERLAVEAPAHRRGRRRLPVLVVALVLLAFAAAALAATGVLRTGAPVRAGTGDLRDPRSGDGAVRTGGVSGVLAQTPDPAGGPPWGMRLIGTTRGLACLQVGRVVDGRLGVLGEDGLFHDDGRFHALPAAVNTPSPFCYPPDADGDLYVATGYAPITAGGYVEKDASRGGGVSVAAPGGCSDGTRTPALTAACPPQDERALYFGMLGPHAASITYDAGGGRRTVATGRGGAYLIVLRTPDRLTAATSSLTPAPGGQPVREIAYRDGSTCEVPVQANGRACPAVGYLRPRVPRQSQVVATLHVTHPLRATPGPGGPLRDDLEVEFTARVAVTSAAAGYELVVGRCVGGEFATGTHTDIAAGTRVRLRIDGNAIGACAQGRATATVYYEQSTPSGAPPAIVPAGPARRRDPFGVDIPVGRSSFTRP
ncbi:MAG TPA: hypothetical protein VG165_04390 [Solirubrobacteraceae bacterium]|nr:hypothetical protein [Solirubrobacteraceae bacterium]